MAEAKAPAVVPTADPFIGRAPAVASLRRAVAESAAGRGSLVLVAGEAGIGKTRLVEEVAAQARDDGHLVLWGSCWDGDGVPAYWPWTEALRRAADLLSVPDEVVALLPDLGSGAAPAVAVDESRFRVFNLVAELLRDLSRDQPTMVVLDDLHWADPGSLEMLRVVASRARTERVVIVGTFRDTDVGAGHRLRELLGDLARHGERVVLDGLDVAQVGELLAASGTNLDAGSLARVAERTGGNPFFVREVARAVGAGDDVPPAVRDVVLRRVERLAVDEAIHDLVGQRLVVTAANGPRFAHALVRETVVDGLPLPRQVRLHADAAAAIEAVSGPVAVDALAFHHMRAAPPTRMLPSHGRQPPGAKRCAGSRTSSRRDGSNRRGPAPPPAAPTAAAHERSC